MKTLKFMLAAATAIGLASATHAAEGVNTFASTGFEKLDVGTNVTTGVQDNRSGYSYFYYAGSVAEDNESVIAAAGDMTGVTRPTGAASVDAGQAKILQVSTGTDPLLRTYAPLSGGAPQTATALSGDVYVDTLVQFTVTPYTDTVTPGANDKLMIYLKESVTTNAMGEITSADTNRVVVGGFYSAGSTTVREYVLNTGAVEVNPNEWHRLTVKAVCDISDSLALGFPGFAIKIDGVDCTLDYYTVDEMDPSSIGPTVIAANPDVLAKKLVLSLLTGSGMQTASLQGVGFAGEGKVDDIVFSDVDPFFTAVDFTFAGVSGVTATQTPGTDTWTITAPAGTVIKSFLVGDNPVAAAVGASSYTWTATSADAGKTVIVAAGKQLTAAAHPWYESPKGFVLAENLPVQSGANVSAFHGQGEEEYLGLTYATNPMQFDLYQVDGTNELTSVYNVPAANAPTDPAYPGFRGVAISKALGIALTMSYYKTNSMYAYPLAGGAPGVVSRPSTHAFDSAAFSPDGKYLFSNAIDGEGSKSPAVVKWSVSANNVTNVALTKVGKIDATGRNRNLAYARINGRDLVFVMADDCKVDVVDMTGDDASAWTVATLISEGLPAHSYGSLCVSGVNATGATPKLTVATSVNKNTGVDVLNVYTLTVPASGTVTAALTKGFTEAEMTAAFLGDISDAVRYGNTVYVTDDDATIYFARPDRKLYAGIYVPKYDITFTAGEGSTTVSVYEGDMPEAPTPATVAGKTFAGWDPTLVAAAADATYTATYNWITYNITYKNADDSTFTEWADGYTAPTTFTAETTVDLPVAANISLSTLGSQFNGWTNETGAVTSTAGLYADLVVFANIGAGSTTPDWVDDPTTVSNQTAATAYPVLDGTALANADAQKLTVWAKANSVAFNDVTAAPASYEEAFLLNCAVADVAQEKEEFVLDISVAADGTITVSLPDGKTYNGTLQMKGSNNLSTWTDVSEASSSYKFYKYDLSL